MDENRSKNLDLPYDEYTRFDLDEMEDPECISEFRVKKLKQFCGPRHEKKLTFSRHHETGLFHLRHVQSTKGGRNA